MLVVAAFAVVHSGNVASLIQRPVRLAAVWAWVLSFASVVVAGYGIELHETSFGAGDPHVRGAAKDAVFTWLHQDLGLFLLPALVLVMLAVERLVDHGRPGWIGWATTSGTSIAFVGGAVWVFVDPTLRGPGYVVSTIGLLMVGVALLATLWWGILGPAQRASGVTAPSVPDEPTVAGFPPQGTEAVPHAAGATEQLGQMGAALPSRPDAQMELVS